MVTREQQLKYIIETCETWPSTDTSIGMSTDVLGAIIVEKGWWDYNIIYKDEFIEAKNKMREQHNFQEWCKSILGFVQAGAEGKEIEYKRDGFESWFSFNNAEYDCISFTTKEEYRIKPKTIKVNGFDVPEPIKGSLPDIYYMPCLSSVDLYSWADNIAGTVDNIRWRRGICHTTKEAAVAHAKALLGIDPNKEDI